MRAQVKGQPLSPERRHLSSDEPEPAQPAFSTLWRRSSHPNKGFFSQGVELFNGPVDKKKSQLPSVQGTAAPLSPLWLLAFAAGERSRESLLLCSNKTKK